MEARLVDEKIPQSGTKSSINVGCYFGRWKQRLKQVMWISAGGGEKGWFSILPK